MIMIELFLLPAGYSCILDKKTSASWAEAFVCTRYDCADFWSEIDVRSIFAEKEFPFPVCGCIQIIFPLHVCFIERITQFLCLSVPVLQEKITVGHLISVQCSVPVWRLRTGAISAAGNVCQILRLEFCDSFFEIIDIAEGFHGFLHFCEIWFDTVTARTRCRVRYRLRIWW